jgi:ankyrin repeat protein
MLKHGAKVEAVDDYGRTPLLVAHSQAAAILLRAKANVFAADKSGNTVFHYAAENGPAHLELLHDGGFRDMNARNKSGWTALHYAAVAGNIDSCRWLLGKGAEMKAVTSASYEYLSLKNAPGYGNELRIAAGLTAKAIAKQRHGANKWVTQRFKEVADLLSQAEKRH